MTSPLILRSSRALSIALAIVLVLASSAARADEAGARAHFRRGVELYDKKQYEPALESFRAAYAEKPAAGIKRNIALCLKGLGRPVEAATAFDEALDEGAAVRSSPTSARRCSRSSRSSPGSSRRCGSR